MIKMCKNEKIEIKYLKTIGDIYITLKCCSNDFFNQCINNEENINYLSKKFSEYARFEVVYYNNQIAGFAAFYCNDNNSKCAFLSMIIVREKFQNKGIGGTLIRNVIFDSIKHGMLKIRLEVDMANKNAISFYEKYGFMKENEKKDDSLFYSLTFDNIIKK